jgi:brefeldin A-resistance guanine nucleotide exchange factor 1
MHDVVRTVFARLFDLDPATEEHKLKSNESEVDSELKMSVGVDAVPSASNAPMESETSIEPSVDKSTPLPLSPERTECMSRAKFKPSPR